MSGDDGPALQDFTSLVDVEIPKIQSLVSSGSLTPADAVTQLFDLEKKTRRYGDSPSTAKLARAILDIWANAQDWLRFAEAVDMLSKRRAQMKQVIITTVQYSMECAENASSMTDEDRIRLFNALRDTTEGKIYLELERARLTRRVSQLYEGRGEMQKSSDMLQSMQVETVTSMELTEKAEYLLEQLRLTLVTDDLMRAELVKNKIFPKKLKGSVELDQQKLRYHQLCVQFFTAKRDALSIAKHYRAAYDSPLYHPEQAEANVQQSEDDKMKEEEDEKEEAPVLSEEEREAQANELFKRAVIFAALAARNMEQASLLQDLKLRHKKRLQRLPQEQKALEWLVSDRLIPWQLPPQEQMLPCFSAWRTHDTFSAQSDPDHGVEQKSRWATLHLRVVQHNIRVIAKFYSRINLTRMAQLLRLDVALTEKVVCELVQNESVWARIDRPAGIVHFVRQQPKEQVLDTWGTEVALLLKKIERTTHFIEKENMVHQIGS